MHCVFAESRSELKTAADGNDITEHPHDHKPKSFLCTVCHKRFTSRQNLNMHVRHTLEKMCIHVLIARNVSHPRLACIGIRMFMQVNTSAQSVAGVLEITVS